MADYRADCRRTWSRFAAALGLDGFGMAPGSDPGDRHHRGLTPVRGCYWGQARVTTRLKVRRTCQRIITLAARGISRGDERGIETNPWNLIRFKPAEGARRSSSDPACTSE